MDDLFKFLKKRTPVERERLLKLIESIGKEGSATKNCLPLKGKPGWFRVRAGIFRVIFTEIDKTISIMRISKRSESTYKKL